MPLALVEHLSPDAALAWMRSRCDFTEPPGSMDVDPLVIAGNGAALYRPSRGASLPLARSTEGIIIDGSLVIDGPLELHGQSLFVLGNLVCRSLFTSSSYLVVAGDLCCDRFLGIDEQYGTIVMGDAELPSVTTFFVYQFSVWGIASIDQADDEIDGRDVALDRLCEWGVLTPETRDAYDWTRTAANLAAWAAKQPPLPEAWAARPFRR